jgi:hypothetical protein
MRTLKELGALVATDTTQRYMRKHASVVNPAALGLGLQLPQIARDAQKRYEDSKRQLALGAITNIGERVAALKAPMDYGHLLGQTGVKTVGSLATDAIKGGLSKGWSMFAHRNDDQARDAVLAELKKSDPIISQASDKTIKDAFGTMVRFAPTLSTDKNAVRSYLREAVMSGVGPNYSTIKSLADAENAVNGKGK